MGGGRTLDRTVYEQTFNSTAKGIKRTADANVRFEELCNLLEQLKCEHRIRGSHHIFTRTGIEEILNLQPRGSLAKPYQVKQTREIILRYQLEIE